MRGLRAFILWPSKPDGHGAPADWHAGALRRPAGCRGRGCYEDLRRLAVTALRDNAATRVGDGRSRGYIVRTLLGISRLIDWINERIGHAMMWLVLAAVLISAGNAVMRKAFDIKDRLDISKI